MANDDMTDTASFLKQTGDSRDTSVCNSTLNNGGSVAHSLHWAFHVRHVWSNLHQSGFKQPWEFSMTSLNSDSLEPWNKRLKVAGNLGPQSTTDSKPEPEIPVVASIYNQVGVETVEEA